MRGTYRRGLWLLVMLLLIGCAPPSQPTQAKALGSRRHAECTDCLFHWKHDGTEDRWYVALPNPAPTPVAVRFRCATIEGELIGCLFFDSDYEIVVGEIQTDKSVMFVRSGEILPYHDHLYRVTFDEQSIQLKQVTDEVPQRYRPNAKAFVVTLTEPKETRDHVYAMFRDNWADYERVRLLRIAEDGAEAQYEGRPYYGSALGGRMEGPVQINDIVHQWSTVVTRVTNIVPPTEIEGVGPLRGWIEFEQEKMAD